MKTYKNISTLEQLGIEPGQTGQAEIHEDQEARMIARGAIEVVGDGKAPEPPAEETKTPEQVQAEADAAEKEAADKKAAEDAEAEAKAAQGRGGRGR